MRFRAYLNFPIRKYHQVIYTFLSGLFSRFYSLDSYYHPRKDNRTSSKEAPNQPV